MVTASDGQPGKKTDEPVDQTSTRKMSSGGRSRRASQQAQQLSWGQIISPDGWVKIVILTGLVLGLYCNEVKRVVLTWIGDPNWGHGFLIPLFSLYFLHQRREQLAKVKFSANWLGLAIIIVSLLGYVYTIFLLKMSYVKLLIFLATILGVVLLLCGWRVIRITSLPILFLFFALPIPRRLYVALTLPLRAWASKVAVAALNLFPNLEVTAWGVVIEGTYKGAPIPPLNVAEQCAGMRLMMAFLALGVAMAFLSDRPRWHRIVLVLATLPIAILCNFIRVIITCILYILVDPMYAQGGFHTTLGLLMLPVAFFLYWLIAEVLNGLYIEEQIPEQA